MYIYPRLSELRPAIRKARTHLVGRDLQQKTKMVRIVNRYLASY